MLQLCRFDGFEGAETTFLTGVAKAFVSAAGAVNRRRSPILVLHAGNSERSAYVGADRAGGGSKNAGRLS
jgi:hypothetical protein